MLLKIWSASRWGCLSICWIKLWTLIPCDRFTIAFGTPEMFKSMFSSSIARLNLFTSSRCSREPTSCTLCELSSTNSTVRSEELSSPCDLPTISWVTNFPVRSSMGLGNRVGLENPARNASPSDCWTSFPTGWCSTVEPDWSFPLIQLRSCVKEIFIGGRGDKYRHSFNISPIFNLSTFKIQWAGSVPWRIIAFDRVW